MLSLACSQAKMENDKKGIDVKRGLEKKVAPYKYLTKGKESLKEVVKARLKLFSRIA
jgi:hypothetical protein